MSATLHPERARRAIRALTIALLIPALAIALSSCSGGGTGSHKSQVVEIIIPPGTQAKLDRGELVNVMPANLSFRIGDVLRVRNDDTADQYAGPYLVQAKTQFELKYGATGRYGGLCNLSGGSSYTIIITE